MNTINIERPKRRKPARIIFLIFMIFMITGAYFGYKLYKSVFQPNVDLGGDDYAIIYIPTGSTYDDVVDVLNEQDILINQASFNWVAKRKHYTDDVRAGMYKINDKMSNNALVNMLRSGLQLPIQLTFNNIRKLDKLAGIVGPKLETDSASIMQVLTNEAYIKEHFDLTLEELPALFLPNTYEIYWNTSAEEFVDRMYDEYQNFWNEERLAKAEEMELSPIQITIIASIVQEETNKVDEMPKIAGVYINRIDRGIPLQACPTIRYAMDDFTITRVLDRHIETESPYNTYKHNGLPPGPICLATPQTINQVLDYEKHDYIFFCAKADFSGYHEFSKTNAEHERYARLYKRAYVEWERQNRENENN
jgi:peptidoglycan lytic transglycosylase G